MGRLRTHIHCLALQAAIARTGVSIELSLGRAARECKFVDILVALLATGQYNFAASFSKAPYLNKKSKNQKNQYSS